MVPETIGKINQNRVLVKNKKLVGATVGALNTTKGKSKQCHPCRQEFRDSVAYGNKKLCKLKKNCVHSKT